MFSNRCDAGRQLGEALRHESLVDPVIVGMWRGGIPVAAEVARVLEAPLDLCVVRKLHAPDDPATTIGAVAEHGAVYLDDAEIDHLALTPSEVDELIASELTAVASAGELLRVEAGHAPISLRGRDVVLVDDGMATAASACAAVRTIRKRDPHAILIATPLAAIDAVQSIRPAVSRVVSLLVEPMLCSIGSRYASFPPVSDGDIVVLLEDSRRRRANPATSRATAQDVRDLHLT
ncbi:MAG TPA: phosphoribosyltransferase family protein [Kofleriaceae bacterium]|nr:phosphoribosyltransferase family protein [Kofleriaceae bacterium]